MRILLIILSLFAVERIDAQSAMTDLQLKEKTDSILAEGNLLYQFEKAAWMATDMVKYNEFLKNDYGGYFVYLQNDTVQAIVLNKKKNDCIYSASFISSLNDPIIEKNTKRELTLTEKHLLSIKQTIIQKIISKKYAVSYPEGFSLNFELLPFQKGYKLYIITGTSQLDIIPLGNDYLFVTDGKGNIRYWRKFHAQLIAQKTVAENGEKIRSINHNHSLQEPFISATDICTFRLYGPLYNLKELSVYSPALSKYFNYKILDNNIDIIDK